jgi:hypothetical protein
MTQGGHPKDFDEEDTCLLEQAVQKLVRFGQQVGVTPEEMISCLILESASAQSRAGVLARMRLPFHDQCAILNSFELWNRLGWLGMTVGNP